MAPPLYRAWFCPLSVLVLASLLAMPATGDGDGGAENVPRDHGLILVKIYCLLIIFFATFLPGVSPYYFRWNETFLLLGIQFAAGVFLATAMLHFLSDSNETFQDRTPKTYPFAMMLAVSGYLLTMLADVIIQSVDSRQFAVPKRESDAEKNINASSTHKFPKAKSDVEANINCSCSILKAPKLELDELKTNNSRSTRNNKLQTDGESPKHSLPNCEFLNYEIGGKATNSSTICDCSELPPDPVAKNLVKATLITRASFGDALLLIFALCFHSVFEGLAIGVAGSKYDAWRNLWTVCLHKVFAAIAMGIALLRMMPDRPLLSCACYAFAFAISSPVGVAIGIAIDATTEGSTADWIYAIAMGLATGVFIYVAVNHLLGKGFVPTCKVGLDKPFFRFIAVTLGAGVIFVVMIWDT